MYTKTGFATDFSCCSSWHICDYGRKKCVYEESDSETMRSCHSYQRNHGKVNCESNSNYKIETQLEEFIIEDEQLSLFI